MTAIMFRSHINTIYLPTDLVRIINYLPTDLVSATRVGAPSVGRMAVAKALSCCKMSVTEAGRMEEGRYLAPSDTQDVRHEEE